MRAEGETWSPNPRCGPSGLRTSTVMALPDCSAVTRIASAWVLSAARFSISTSTSGLSQARTSTDPSKVVSDRSGVPVTWKRLSS